MMYLCGVLTLAGVWVGWKVYVEHRKFVKWEINIDRKDEE
jgi:hypothetical protein